MRLIVLSAVFAAALFLGSAASFGQDEGEEPDDPARPGRKGDRNQEKMLEKVKEELGLSDEQLQKFRELKAEEMQKMREFRDAQDKKIRELLTEEQRAKYEEMEKRVRKAMNRPGREEGERPGRRGDPLEMVKLVAKELGLTEQQQEAIKELAKESRNQMMKILEEARNSGDFSKVKETVERLQKDLEEKVRSMLNDEQKTKFDAFLKEGRDGLKKLIERRGGGDRPGNPEEVMKARVREIQKSLDLLPEEGMIIMPKIEGILKAQSDLQTKMREQRKAAEELLKSPDVTEETIGKELAIWRQARQEDEKKIEKMQADLKELLTLKQEAKLVLHGVLR